MAGSTRVNNNNRGYGQDKILKYHHWQKVIGVNSLGQVFRALLRNGRLHRSLVITFSKVITGDQI